MTPWWCYCSCRFLVGKYGHTKVTDGLWHWIYLVEIWHVQWNLSLVSVQKMDVLEHWFDAQSEKVLKLERKQSTHFGKRSCSYLSGVLLVPTVSMVPMVPIVAVVFVVPVVPFSVFFLWFLWFLWFLRFLWFLWFQWFLWFVWFLWLLCFLWFLYAPYGFDGSLGCCGSEFFAVAMSLLCLVCVLQFLILLMGQKSQTTTVWMYKTSVNNGINYQPQLVRKNRISETSNGNMLNLLRGTVFSLFSWPKSFFQCAWY